MEYIYFEKQAGDMMCGVHSINALLQGPYFDEIKLSEIGLALDREEQQLFGGGNKGAQAMYQMDA